MTSPTLDIENLSCVRGERLLFENLNFGVSAGQCLHVTGPNGCGKTSLLRIVAGLGEAENGSVKWQNQTIQQSHDYYTYLAYIGHKDGLKNELTAFENLSFYQQLNCERNEAVIDDYLHKLNILECADLLAYKLSFGQRRRLAFARLLVKPHKLWILDEPFTGIDSAGHTLIESLCQQHLDNQGLIVMTNHGDLDHSLLSNNLTELALH